MRHEFQTEGAVKAPSKKGQKETEENKMKFYCMKCQKSVEVENHKTEVKKGRKFAVATHTCGTKVYRIMGKA